MTNKKTSSMGEHSERPTQKQDDPNPDKRDPNPDDPYEEKGPPLKEMPIISNPHQEEIVDRRPE